MKKQALVWMAGITLGATLYGVDTGAAPAAPGPGTTPPPSPCTPPLRTVNSPPWPAPSQCGDPAFRQQCPGLDASCTAVIRAEEQRLSSQSGEVGGKSYSNNKLYGVPKTRGFTNGTKQHNYGVGTTRPAGPAPTNAVMTNLAAQRAALQKKGVVGQRHPALGPNNNARWAYRESQARVDALAWKPSRLLEVYQRPHTAPGASTVGSCEDYVYKGFYDDERWLDAIYGCKGDARCETNVSLLPTTPGIAGRALQNPLMPSFTQFIPDYDGSLEFRGMMPKNSFYAGTGAFITDSLVAAFASDPAKSASMKALASALRDGMSTYDIGHGKNGNSLGTRSQGFSDEWDFHRVMNARTANITEGEFDEYKRRNDKVIAAMDHFWTTAKCVAHLNPNDCKGVPNAVGHTFPGETQMFDGDPFTSRATFGNVNMAVATDMLSFVNSKAGMMDALNAGAHIGSGLAFPGLANRAAVAMGTPLNQTGFAGAQGGVQLNAPKLNAPVAPGPGATQQAPGIVNRQSVRLKQPESPGVGNFPLAYLDLNWRQKPPVIDRNSTYPRLVCPSTGTGKPSTPATSWTTASQKPSGERFLGELAACQAVNVILEEWARKQAADTAPPPEPGQTAEKGTTCFDTGNAACDWSPSMFVKRWVVNTTGYNMHAKERAYSDCKAWKTKLFENGAKTHPDPPATLNAINDAERVRKEDLRGLPVKQIDNFGQDKADQHTAGNHAFGVGYSYDLGWEAKIFARDPSDNTPCRMGGRVHSAFDAQAWAFGLPPIDIVEASLGIDANDDKNQQQTDALQAYGHGDFLNGAYEFYKIPDNTTFKLSAVGSPPYMLPGVHDGDEETIVRIPVQISWVTLTFTIGMSWGYGADMFIYAQAPTKNQCTKDLFKVGGGVVPYAHLDLVVGAECSIAGIAGVGVDVDIVLLDIKLPLHGGASLTASQDAKLYLGFDAGLDLQLGTLDGHMSAFASFIGIKLFEVELFHWKGLHTTVPIFHFQSKKFELADLGGNPVPPGDGAMTCFTPGVDDPKTKGPNMPFCPPKH
jgi:hypothetical protein